MAWRLALSLLLSFTLAACAWRMDHDPATVARRLATLLPADAILLGEQHDAPEHQRVHQDVVQALAARGELAALALEMAEQGHSSTGLARDASEAQVRTALHWDARAWPWEAYGPAVMAAVRAGVPVLGANLPRAQMRTRMADDQLDRLLPGPAFQAQQELIRLGHCEMLPQSQITPMTRVQIARDLSMAQTLRAAAVAGKTVLLLAGRGHVDRRLGIPQHLPPGFRVKAVAIGAIEPQDAAQADEKYDLAWPAAPGPDIDHCAQFRPTR